MADAFFPEVTGRIPFGGLDATDPLAYRVYDPDRLVLGKRMEDHLRIAVCLWHSFAWPGSDVFGVGTFDRPWLDPRLDPMVAARAKLDAAFEFLTKLGIPYFCFHDRDVSPEGATARETQAMLEQVVDDIGRRMADSGMKLLWGTANLFSHPRYAAGAATNPDPAIFAVAAAQVKSMLDATHRLGGENYVLWGGREGYETLLNTDLKREEQQFARFLALVAEHKHRIGFTGLLLIEPKPQEPTKHQYDYDVAAVLGFLQRHGLEGEYPGQSRGQPRDAGRAQLPPRGRRGDRRRDLRQHRRQSRRRPERLGHRPVPELRRRALARALRDRPSRRVHDGRLQLRHEAPPPEHEPG